MLTLERNQVWNIVLLWRGVALEGISKKWCSAWCIISLNVHYWCLWVLVLAKRVQNAKKAKPY